MRPAGPPVPALQPITALLFQGPCSLLQQAAEPRRSGRQVSRASIGVSTRPPPRRAAPVRPSPTAGAGARGVRFSPAQHSSRVMAAATSPSNRLPRHRVHCQFLNPRTEGKNSGTGLQVFCSFSPFLQFQVVQSSEGLVISEVAYLICLSCIPLFYCFHLLCNPELSRYDSCIYSNDMKLRYSLHFTIVLFC